MTVSVTQKHSRVCRVCFGHAACRSAKRRPVKLYGSFSGGFTPVTPSAYGPVCKFSWLQYTPCIVFIPGVLPMVTSMCVDAWVDRDALQCFVPPYFFRDRHFCTNAHGIHLMIGAIFHKFSQLILMKIIKIVATRCQILRIKCTKFNFG